MTGEILPLVLPETQVQDIDSQTDWELAQIKYRFMIENQGKEG